LAAHGDLVCPERKERTLIEVSSPSPSLTLEPERQSVRHGQHRKADRVPGAVARHSRRLASFSLIGFGVFALGVCLEALSVREGHMPKETAYVTQLLLSVQLNFLANYKWTWGDRKAPFWRSCFRYNLKRGAGTVLSLALYPVLVRLGVNYLVANALLVILLTPVNYILGHWWTFSSRGSEARSSESSADPRPDRKPASGQRAGTSLRMRRVDLADPYRSAFYALNEAG
jgi:putative flippase GtrA